VFLLLDGDLGFVLALAQELRGRRISAFPACTVRQAESLLRDLHLDLDALVINCRIRGACTFIERISKEQWKVKIIGIISRRHRCRKCSSWMAAQFRDPEDKTPERIQLLGEVIQRTLTRAAASNWPI
jgi:hypothetical protein